MGDAIKLAAEDVDGSAKKATIKAKKKEMLAELQKSGNVWIERERGKMFYSKLHSTSEKLGPGVWLLDFNPFAGFFLTSVAPTFHFGHKIYGLEKKLIERVHKSYAHIDGNIGILFNGVKGTGKTVTAKMICNEFIKKDIPVILVNEKIEGGMHFINSIRQDLVVFVDEYEKVYKKGEDGDRGDVELLTVMDGTSKSKYKRTFLLTTNNLHINENMLQRPGRIRYLKQFGDMSKSVVEEIVDDKLVHKKWRDELVRFIMSLEIITIDIVSAVIQEVNIHNESPEEFRGIFNVKTLEGKYDVEYNECTETGVSTSKIESLAKGAKIWPREFNSDHIGNSMQINENYIGRIMKVIDSSTAIIVTTEDDFKDSKDLFQPGGLSKRIAEEYKADHSEEGEEEMDEKPLSRRKGKNKKKMPAPKPIFFEVKIEKSYMVNRRSWGEYGDGYSW